MNCLMMGISCSLELVNWAKKTSWPSLFHNSEHQCRLAARSFIVFPFFTKPRFIDLHCCNSNVAGTKFESRSRWNKCYRHYVSIVSVPEQHSSVSYVTIQYLFAINSSETSHEAIQNTEEDGSRKIWVAKYRSSQNWYLLSTFLAGTTPDNSYLPSWLRPSMIKKC